MLNPRNFRSSIGLFVMSYSGIAISIWPFIVPYKYTLWEAASSELKGARARPSEGPKKHGDGEHADRGEAGFD